MADADTLPDVALAEAEVAWRPQLEVALDAMKTGRIEEAELLFDQLDEMCPGWHFVVPYRAKRNTVRHKITCGHQNARVVSHTYSPDRRVKQILAAMLYLAHTEANHHRGRPYGAVLLARAFGVAESTMKGWISYGLIDLGLADDVFIEDDYDPPEERRELRRQQLEARGVITRAARPAS